MGPGHLQPKTETPQKKQSSMANVGLVLVVCFFGFLR